NQNEELKRRSAQLARLSSELTMAEQRERRRLSKILHDGLQQHLAAAKLQLGGIAVHGRDDQCAGLNDIETLLEESIQMSRSLSSDLSPPALHEGGLAAGLEWLARRMEERHAFRVDLEIRHHPELPEDVKILVFESVRELLFNASKHAGVSEAKVRLQPMHAAGLEICVSDRGAGFDPAHMAPSGEAGGGFGLFSIRERLGLIGGTLTIASTPGKGSCFTLILPHPIKPVSVAEARSMAAPAVPAGAEAELPGPFIRVLLVDDHTLFRDGIARLLGKEPDIAVVGQAENGQEAVQLARRLNPHVILMDINMPVLNGIEATRIIHAEAPSIRIIGLSMHEDEEPAQLMFKAGAVGYKNKSCPVAELIEAVRQ
ncbi:MAG: response regulator, partial [Desulfobacteraceae bacterium]